VVTIRMSGIPPHVTEADFNCWFMFAQGFEQATLAPSKGPGVPQAGWARFSTPEAAQGAIYHLNGRRLTPDQYAPGATILAELAKRNFRPRNPAKQQAQPPEDYGADAPSLTAAVGGTAWSGAGAWRQSAGVPQSGGPARGHDAGGGGGMATLFVFRLLDESAEEEIRQLCLEQCPGYERLKFVPPSGGKTGMCFLKFTHHREAAAALEVLRGYALSAAPTEAMHVDFAKAELDEPKRQWADSGDSAVSGHGPHSLEAVAAAVTAPAAGGVAHSWGQHPCDTMFIGNISASVTDEELSNALTTLDGYERMKLVGQGSDRAMAFALFDSAQSCGQAIQILHGNALPSAPSVALTCEFSKNSLGKAVRSC